MEIIAGIITTLVLILLLYGLTMLIGGKGIIMGLLVVVCIKGGQSIIKSIIKGIQDT